MVNGKCLKKNYFLKNELMIQMIEFEIMLHQKGFSLVDIQLDNFMIDKNNQVFYIDYGGIEDINTAYSKFHKPYYDTLDEPEETKGKMDDVIPNYNEQIEIFYYGLFLKESFCILNNKINNVVSKMIEFKCFSRYKHFTEIINDL